VDLKKAGLRARYKARLNSLSPEEKRSQSAALLDQLRDYFSSLSGCWTIYSPLNDEPNLLGLLKEADHITWVFPKIQDKKSMQFYRVDNPDAMLSQLYDELLEPKGDPGQCVPSQGITGLLVPGLAFDEQGTRLGRGGGYYDRYLENYKGLKLGVTFNEGIAREALPRESHDQQMNVVVSPQSWLTVEASEVSHGF
jgi:5-formyltetrahydrofolate cyclo-ligase